MFVSRTFLFSLLFAGLQASAAHAAPSLCNGPPNGVLDGDEQCETGACCTAKCELRAAAFVCRDSADGVCDTEEACGEISPVAAADCPADVFADNGTPCDDEQFCTSDDACSDGECLGAAAQCDDDNPCTADSCDERRDECASEPAEEGTACDDANACTSGDECTAGECSGGQQVSCSDNNDCTDDTCDAETGECVFANNTAPCDDGLFCTTNDACSAGVCAGGGVNDCSDEEACTLDTCDEDNDECDHGDAPDATPCDDGLFCTTADACAGGVCTGGGAPECDDGNDCTEDSCNEGSDSCRNQKVQNGTPCEDDDLCTSDDTCTNGECGGGEPVVCTDNNDCTDDACEPASGECSFTNNTAPCDDGAFCTTGDVCAGGVCTGGQGNGCDDGDPCTSDSCNEETDACTFGNAVDGTPCDDGLFCTLGDVCTAGVCAGPVENTCDDGDECSNDSCNEGNDSCKNSPANNGDPCDDGSFCTVDDSCHQGSCEGAARGCSDDNLCTDDVCNDETDACENPNNSTPCDDGIFCTTGDTCAGGSCSVSTPTCDDDNQCTDDACNEEAGTCSNLARTGACDDTLFCTDGDACVEGVCVPGPVRDCGDSNICTTDVCNEAGDACDNLNNTVLCDDLQFCTVDDTCAGGVCAGTARDCSDGNVCTTDTCDEATDACGSTNNTAPCDDGQFCSEVDTCAGGACVAGAARTCDDANACTDGTCNEETDSCDQANNTGPCDDTLFCTQNDTCSGGLCSGTERNCGDANICTTDVCNDTTDVCDHLNNTVLCDDLLFCTVDDQCAGGVCTGAARDCGDANPCTTDACNDSTNACENPNNTLPCDDGSFCTAGDVCSGGSCTSGAARSCGDGNACTDDSCNEAGDACVNANNTAACDDGDACTTADICAGGVCTGTDDPSCATTTTTEPCPVCGDFNGDCQLTASDAQQVLRSAVGLVSCPLTVCDFNGSGGVTAGDALLVLRASVGIPSTPMCPVA